MPALVGGPRHRSAPSETLTLLGRAIDAGAFGPAPLGAAAVAAVAAAPFVPICPPVRSFERRVDETQVTTPPDYQPYRPSFAAGAVRNA